MIRLFVFLTTFFVLFGFLFLEGKRRTEFEGNRVAALGETWMCGHWVVYRICQTFGVVLDHRDVEKALPYSSNGHSLAELIASFSKIGLQADARRLQLEDLQSISLPYVIKLDSPDHFLAVVQQNNSGVLAFDGSGRRRLISWDQLRSRFSGYALTVHRVGLNPLPKFANRSSTQQATIQFDSVLKDFGHQEPVGETYKFTFKFWNLGDQPLRITKVHVRCSCLNVEYPQELLPKEEGKLTVYFSSSDKKNYEHFSEEIVVESNDPDFSFVELVVQGTVKRRIDASVRSIQFNKPRMNQDQHAYVVLFVHGDDPKSVELNVSRCSVDSISTQWISIEDFRRQSQEKLGEGVVKIQSVPDMRIRVLRITFSATWSADLFQPIGHIAIKSNLQNHQEIPIQIALPMH
jgi:hypothetical protein